MQKAESQSISHIFAQQSYIQNSLRVMHTIIVTQKKIKTLEWLARDKQEGKGEV